MYIPEQNRTGLPNKEINFNRSLVLIETNTSLSSLTSNICMFTLSEDVHTYAQSKFEHSAACTNRINTVY